MNSKTRELLDIIDEICKLSEKMLAEYNDNNLEYIRETYMSQKIQLVEKFSELAENYTGAQQDKVIAEKIKKILELNQQLTDKITRDRDKVGEELAAIRNGEQASKHYKDF